MAYRTKSNLVSSRDEYSRYYPGFTGVDFTSDPADVAPTRFAYAKNMWRDWESEQGGAVETVPGYRLLREFSGKINGIHEWQKKDGTRMIALHAGEELYVFAHAERDNIADISPVGVLADHRSAAFVYQSALYILDGSDYYRLSEDGGSFELSRVADGGYIPISYSDALPYEQRNMISDKFINRYNLGNLDDYLADTEPYSFDFSYDVSTMTATLKGFSENVKTFEGTDLQIPKTVSHDGNTYKVTEIADGAFADWADKAENNAIYSVYIHSGIKRIGRNAFRNCNLFCVRFLYDTDGKSTDLEHIGEWAFSDNNIDHVFIPSGNERMMEISAGAFGYNSPGMVAVVTKNVINAPDMSENFVFAGTENLHVFYEENSSMLQISSDSHFKYDCKINVYPLTQGKSEPDVEVEISRVFTECGDVYYDENTGRIKIEGDGLCVVETAGYETGQVYYAFTDYPGESTTIYEYRFTVYDKALSIEHVDLNGFDISNNTYYSKIGYIMKDGYVTEVSVSTTNPDRLRDGVLTIHGTAEASTFTTVEGYVDALAGNSDYKGTAREAICGCTICAAYDGRIFLSGNPALPNTVFYSHRDLTGFNNPAYFGVLNFFNDGAGYSAISAMMATHSQLCVLKGDTVGEGSIYYHSGADGGSDILPRVYPSVQGLAGLGCTGAACNFLDDPVFLSKRGLEAIGKEQVNLERTIEHRSYNVDTKLTWEDLSSARLAEWIGYLVIMCKGRFYLADSRQLFQHKTGALNYEWYYLEDIGQWRGQVERYHTLTEDSFFDVGGEIVPLTELSIYADGEYHPLVLDRERRYAEPGEQIREFPWYNGNELTEHPVYYVKRDGQFVLVDTDGEMIGGEYFAPCEIASVDGVLYFGCEGGGLYCFNTDKRGQSVIIGGEEVFVDRDRIHESFYSFAGRRYLSGCSTKSDNCDIPHLTKQTRRGSFIVRVKPFAGSTICARGRIDRGELSEWRELTTQSASRLDFAALSFGSFSSAGGGTQLCIVREAFRRWYEKQIYFYSDEYLSPFGIYSAAYRYCIQGRIKI